MFDEIPITTIKLPEGRFQTFHDISLSEELRLNCMNSDTATAHPISCSITLDSVISRGNYFMADAASQAGDADSSRAPGLTSGLQGSVNVHHGALLLVPQ